MKRHVTNPITWIAISLAFIVLQLVLSISASSSLAPVAGTTATIAAGSAILLYVRQAATKLSTALNSVSKMTREIGAAGSRDAGVAESLAAMDARLKAVGSAVQKLASSTSGNTPADAPLVNALATPPVSARGTRPGGDHDRLFLVGNPDLPLLPTDWGRVAILPGQIPPRSAFADVKALIIDESAFASGPWRSFSRADDEFLIGQLHRLLEVAEAAKLAVATIRSDATPDHLQLVRRSGLVVPSDEALSESVLGLDR